MGDVWPPRGRPPLTASTSQGDDANLLRRFRDGDEEAFRILFQRYGNALSIRIRQCLPARLLRKVAVSDVLQESLLVAFKRRADFEDRGEEAFRHWLLTIVELRTKEAVRHFDGTAKRSSRREITRSRRGATAQAIARHPSPSQVAIGAELGNLARRAMAALPDDYREVLRLIREARIPYSEAAERMGRSEAAVRKLYGRALARFRAAFEGLRGRTGA